VHEVFDALMTREGWLGDLPQKGNGAREGWWGVSPAAERFLDELVTWRELGFNFTSKRDDYDLFESLPAWAQQTLEAHQTDDREHIYDGSEFELARTHDPLWNAAQRQLVIDGRIHNYLRMLWGKKILEWSATPREALATMIELNNKYALDGRDPSSYSGIFWVLGRYDRPWHPQRPVFGSVRYMSSANTARKMRVKQYVTRYGGLATD
jgi:deoxyribodipyrimidine photo-lyase